MFKVQSDIKIGQYAFNHVVDVDIHESIDTLTDTCTITINRKFEWQGKNIALGDDAILKRKDKVIVRGGYDGDLETLFIGYVKNIKSGVPVVIECEDSMLLLKKGPLTITYDDVGLNKLLQDILPTGIEFKTAGDKDIHLGAFREPNKITAAQVLEKLKTEYGLYSYFRLIDNSTGTDCKAVLYVGFAYWDDRNEASIKFGTATILSHDLTYRKNEDIEMKVKAISMQENNSKIEIEVGDKDGEVRTVHAYKLTKAQLKVYADAELERFKYTGFKGEVTCYAQPFFRKCDVANIIGDKYHPDGKYFIKGIKRKLGNKGIRQVLQIDAIVSDKVNSTGN